MNKYAVFIAILIAAIVMALTIMLPLLVMYYIHPLVGAAIYFLIFFLSAKSFYKQQSEKQEKRELAIKEAKKLGLSDDKISDLLN